MKPASFLLSLFLLGSIACHATVLDVPASYTTIQSALNACSTGDTVLVQPGTYFENIVWPDMADIKLFSAGDSSNTVIDGGGINSVIKIVGYLLSVTIDTNTVIKGFKITGGGYSNAISGGGVVMYSCSPKLEEVSITANYTNYYFGAGAGITAGSSDFILFNSSVTYNVVDTGSWAGGAGIDIDEGHPIIRNVNVSNNLAIAEVRSEGAGVRCYYASPIFEDVVVSGNSTANISTSRHEGGGMFFGYCPSVILNNVSVNNNFMGDGSTEWDGGGLYFKADTFVQLTNVSVYNNTMGNSVGYRRGGGIFLSADSAYLTNVVITDNQMGISNNAGGGIYIINSTDAYLTNVLIADNQMMGVSNNVGGGIYISNSNNLNIINSTIVSDTLLNNNNITGAGIFFSGTTNINCTNCILWNKNLGAEFDSSSNAVGSTTINYSNIRGGYPGTGNIDTLPGFVSATDFHLTQGSPCINAGTLGGAPPFDLDNMPRPAPAGTNPDMGCYEFNQTVGISDFGFSVSDFSVYPNPAKDKLSVTCYWLMGKTAILKIVDVFGRIIFQKSLDTNILRLDTKIDVGQFSNGIYFVEITSGDHTSVKKFIKE